MDVLKLKPIINKANGGVVVSIPKSKMPKELQAAFKNKKVDMLNMKLAGFDLRR